MKKIILSSFAIVIFSSISAQTMSSIELVSTSRVASEAKPSLKGLTSSEDGKHVVQKGETLSSIARLYGTSYQNIALLNSLTSETIKVGQILKVPAKEETGSRGAGERTQGSTRGLLYAKKQISHTVQAGDDIYSIADAYNVKVEEIRKLNNLPSDAVNFRVGESVVYSETYEATQAENVESRDLNASTEPSVEVEVESPPLEVTPPPATAPKTETVVPAPIPVQETLIVNPLETAIAGERMESGTFLGIEDKNQSNPYYIYHKTLPIGTKVRLHIPDNAGFVEATVVNRINAQRKEIVGLSPACHRLIGGKAALKATISYLP